MSQVIIYHNPRCSKSRQTVELLKTRGVNFKIIEYLKNPLNESELKELLEILQEERHFLVRKKETLFKELNPPIKNSAEIAKLLAKHPQLMERPLVVNNNKATLGRPPESVLEIL